MPNTEQVGTGQQEDQVSTDGNSDLPIEVESEPVSAKDQFFLQWGLDSLKGSVPALNDMLQKIVVLDTALIGGSFIGVKEGAIQHWWGFVIACSIMVSLVAALWGVFPQGREVNLYDPNDIQTNEYSAINRKARMMRVAFIALVFGLLLAVLSLAVRGAPTPAVQPPPIPAATE